MSYPGPSPIFVAVVLGASLYAGALFAVGPVQAGLVTIGFDLQHTGANPAVLDITGLLGLVSLRRRAVA